MPEIDTAYDLFARTYPHEAHDDDPERFWAWFHEQRPNVSREEMRQFLEETADAGG